MFAIKIWLTKNENDWFYLRDLKDQVIHAWGRKEKAEIMLKSLTCFKAEIDENFSAYAIVRINKKKQKSN